VGANHLARPTSPAPARHRDQPREPVAIERWFHMRALVEARIEDSDAGMALRHLPRATRRWTGRGLWSAFLALNCSAWLHGPAGIDTGPDGWAHGKRLRRELTSVPRPGALPRSLPFRARQSPERTRRGRRGPGLGATPSVGSHLGRNGADGRFAGDPLGGRRWQDRNSAAGRWRWSRAVPSR
jgi:hypothetical protein